MEGEDDGVRSEMTSPRTGGRRGGVKTLAPHMFFKSIFFFNFDNQTVNTVQEEGQTLEGVPGTTYNYTPIN